MDEKGKVGKKKRNPKGGETRSYREKCFCSGCGVFPKRGGIRLKTLCAGGNRRKTNEIAGWVARTHGEKTKGACHRVGGP